MYVSKSGSIRTVHFRSMHPMRSDRRLKRKEKNNYSPSLFRSQFLSPIRFFLSFPSSMCNRNNPRTFQNFIGKLQSHVGLTITSILRTSFPLYSPQSNGTFSLRNRLLIHRDGRKILTISPIIESDIDGSIYSISNSESVSKNELNLFRVLYGSARTDPKLEDICRLLDGTVCSATFTQLGTPKLHSP